jgi:hypothetical protein
MRQSNQIDLKTEGGNKTVTVTPGNAVTLNIVAQQSRIGASGGGRGLYNNIRGIKVQCSMIAVRSSGGTTPVYWDQFPRAIASVNWQTPLFGTIVDPQVVDGMVLKHIAEFHARNYNYDGIGRLPLPGTDGTYTRNFELYIPLAYECNDFPDHMNHWLGWFDESFIELTVSSAAQPFGLSGVTITSVTFSAELDTVPEGNIVIPPLAVVRKYQQAASSGSNGPTLIGLGNNGSLQGMDDASRLMGLFFMHQVGGFTGSGTADQIASINLAWRDQAQTTLPAAFFQRYLRNVQAPMMGALTGQDLVENKPPYIMWANPASTGGLNSASARYTPIVWPERGNLFSQIQKVKGNYPIDMAFNANQSGSFTVLTIELKQYSKAKCSEMLAAMNINPTTVKLVPKLGRKNKGDVNPDKFFCLPRSVEAIQAKAA